MSALTSVLISSVQGPSGACMGGWVVFPADCVFLKVSGLVVSATGKTVTMQY